MLKWVRAELRGRAFLALLLAVIAGIAGALFVRTLIIAGHDIADGQPYQRYLVIVPLLTAIFLAAKWFSHEKIALVAEQALHQRILAMANQIRHAELADLEHHSRVEIYETIGDALTVTHVARSSVTVVRCLTTIFVSWLYMWSISPIAGVEFIVLFGVLYFVTQRYEQRLTSAVHEAHDQETVMFRIFHHLLAGHKELAVNRPKNDDLFEHYLKPAVLRTAALIERTSAYHADYNMARDAMYYVMLGGMVFMLAQWHSTLQLLSLLTLSLYMWPLIVTVFKEIPGIVEGNAALARLYELSEALTPRQNLKSSLGLPEAERMPEFRCLTLEAVRFGYPTPGGTPEFAVGPLTLTINAGELLFLTGGNGSGKTTLLKLLTGLYAPWSGVMSLNEEPVYMQEHRYLFAAIFNDFHLFDSLYGLAAVDGRQVNAFLLQMELLHKTQWTQGRFSTLALSAGQKRRLAMIVALMEAKPICIFDEWAADQAPHFRRHFYEELLPALKRQGKTVIAVTHDDHYYHVADRVIKMEYGKIIAE